MCVRFSFLALLLAVVFGGCASTSSKTLVDSLATLAQREKVADDYEGKASSAKILSDMAKEDLRKAHVDHAEALRAEASSREATAAQLKAETEATVARLKTEAEAMRHEACTHDKNAPGCSSAVVVAPITAIVVDPVQKTPVPAPAPVVVTPVPPTQFVDINIIEFAPGGIVVLNPPFPEGWNMSLDKEAPAILLKVAGQVKQTLKKPANFKSGTCYRFSLPGVVEIACPPAEEKVR